MRKQLKGFTLVEIIIAFAIFGILATMVCTAVASASKGIQNVNQMNNKVENQMLASNSAKLADAAVVNDKPITGVKTITIGGSGADVSGTVNINVKYYEKDKTKIDTAVAAVAAGTASDEQKKIARDADVPNLKYAKLP